MVQAGGIDVGGTKIESRLFASDWQVVESRRVITPTSDYDALLAAIEEQYRWLEQKAGDADIPIGVGVPGLVDQATGHMVIANLPVENRNLRDDLVARVHHPVHFLNDCRAFTLSEAKLGAGIGFDVVLGLVLGTGVAGGLTVRGELVSGHNGAAGEFGHSALPASLIAKYDLPILTCACGNQGCFETYISGPGMSRLASAKMGVSLAPAEIYEKAAAGDQSCAQILDIWSELTCELLRSLVLCVDPDCIVLGGGLSKLPDIVSRLSSGLKPRLLTGLCVPEIRLAQGGDSSGTRGAALAALTASGICNDV